MNDDHLIDMALSFIVFMLGNEALSAFRSPKTRVVLRGLRWRHFVRAVPLFLGVLVVAALAIVYLPYGDVGWWSALGGQGNVVFANAGPRPDPSWIQRWAPAAALVLIAFAAPSMVKLEERWFRRAADRRSPARGVVRQAGFGAAHMVLGVPVGAALALAVAGLVFQRAYLQGLGQRGSRWDALMASTRLHLAYNYTALLLVALILALQAAP